MKILITDKQLNLLILEQTAYERFLDKTYADPKKAQKYNKEQQENFGFLTSHNGLMVMGIATAFIPIIGPFLSAGIGLIDATKYKAEGDTKTAGLVAMFSFLPAVGSLASKIPGISKLGKEGMSKLASKLMSGDKNMTPLETEVTKAIMENPKSIESAVESEIKSLASSKIKTVTNQSLKSSLSTIVKSGLQAGKTIGKEGAKAGAAMVTYNKSYDILQSETPKAQIEKGDMNWEYVKQSFGSSGSEEDNKNLLSAWKEGWRPGKVVPQKYQTKLYVQNYSEEREGLDKLIALMGGTNLQKPIK